jgi:glutathione S-transferase
LAPVKVRLYTVPASHPGKTAAAMLAYKGIPYKRTDLLPFVSRTAVRVIGFPDKTVPAMMIDGRKIQKSRAIGQELDRVQPEPPLYPCDPEKLKAVLEVERFGDEELQSNIRRIVLWGVRHSPEARLSYLQESKLPVPLGLAAKTGGPLVALAARQNEASDEKTRPYLAELPALLQRVDDEIAAGTIDGEELNAADFQIAGSIRLALTMRDLRPFIDSRPAGRFARRVIPDFAGDMPEVIPSEWLKPLSAASAPASTR